MLFFSHFSVSDKQADIVIHMNRQTDGHINRNRQADTQSGGQLSRQKYAWSTLQCDIRWWTNPDSELIFYHLFRLRRQQAVTNNKHNCRSINHTLFTHNNILYEPVTKGAPG